MSASQEKVGGYSHGIVHIGIVVLGKYVQEAAVYVWFDIVELSDVCMLEPVDEHFNAKDQ